jgi:multidrug resistance efflux pump
LSSNREALNRVDRSTRRSPDRSGLIIKVNVNDYQSVNRQA